MVRKQRNRDKAVDKKPVVKHDDPEQSERFLKAAQEHEAATTEEAARRVFRKIVEQIKRKR